MDKKQIVTILVTAVITAIIKEVVTWFISIIKNGSVISIFKTIFSKQNRIIMWDILSLACYLFWVISYVNSPSPPTRFSVVIIMFLILGTIFMVINLLWHIAKLFIEREKQKKNSIEASVEFGK